MKPLTVYKASAGSGKTFRLTVEYIALLINNPQCFKNILAVTFTNKATEEMKMRILSQLYGLWKRLPDSDSYMREITAKLSITETQASQQAGVALSCLIHNYNYFRVETIDSFFQSIMRNLAHELDLTANLRIGLNDKQVEEQAVDQLIESLSSTSILLQWLISYIFSNIDENKSWNIIKQIKEFGANIFKDFYKDTSAELNIISEEKNFFKQYTKQLEALREEIKKRMSWYADEFVRMTENAGLTPTSYSNKEKGICSYFNKLRGEKFSDKECINATLNKCLENAEKWAAKTSPDRKAIINIVNGGLMDLLHKAETERPRAWKIYSSIKFTLGHLNRLRLLNSIETKVRELNDEANLFLLSDTQHLLRGLIKDNDTPFIFEKAGCMLEHIMIDEFQDTSTVQWQNFKVLLKECMSRANDKDNTVNNLIVGDVKQSIYRWRSGEWRLLNDIETQFDTHKDNIEVHSMQKNFRSERNIVDFNNAFFTLAIQKEHENELKLNTEDFATEIDTAYKDVCQEPRSKERNGLVEVTMLPSDEYEDNTLAIIEKEVDRLMECGVLLNEIAILVRRTKHARLIADYFMKKRHDISIVSDEAFRLDASAAVNIIVQALRLLTHPDDILTKAELAVTYQKKVLGNGLSDSKLLIKTREKNNVFDELLPEEFISKCDELPKESLFNIIETIFSSFKLNYLSDQSAYVCAFYDLVSEFTANTPGCIDDFLTAWEEELCSKTIQSDKIDGIHLITIHKSKGLEFDNVIVPFCDWTLNRKDETLWCRPKVSPFNSLPLVPVGYTQDLLETIYDNDYRNEHIQKTVDNLNLLYVAFTRARKNLFVLGKRNNVKNGASSRSKLICDCLPRLSEQLESSTLTGLEGEDVPLIFSYGCLYAGHRQTEMQSANVFMRPTTPCKIKIETTSHAIEFKQSNKSRDFINSDDDTKDDRQRYIKTGNVLHKLFSMIRTTADIEGVLRQLEYDGVLYDSDITSEKMRTMLSNILSDSHVSHWFSPHWQVFNECNILYIDKETGKLIERRPDRVITDGSETIVIDFKFGKPRNEYRKQIRQYMGLLSKMGHNDVKGYLWFVYTNEIEKVEVS